MSFESLSVIRLESRRFGRVLGGLDGALPVPTCPGWNAEDLLWHLTEVQRFWSLVLSSGATTDQQIEAIEKAAPVRPPERAALLTLQSRATEDLLAALASGPLDAPAWSWFPGDQSAGFTMRMQMHEATIHRVDAELTAALPVGRIEADVASAGIDHVIDVMWNWVPETAACTTLGVIELDPVDAEARWVELYRWSGEVWGRGFTDQIGARRAGAGATPGAIVRATTMQLDLLVWSRPAEVATSGDAQLLAAFDELIAFGIQ